MSDRERSAGSVKPVFVDNRDGNTLARAIATHLAALRSDGRTPSELCVASCYFNPQGLELIAGEARHVPRLRLLLGADPTPEALLPRRTPYDPTEPEFTRRRVGQGLAHLEGGLRRDRDLLPFDLEEDRAIRNLLEFLRSGRIEVRRYEGQFLHAKAFLFRGETRGILVGSANLTRAGLQTNIELVLGHHEDPLVARVEEWFESLWREAAPFDLAAIYAEMLAEYPPYLVYLKVLWRLYHAELEEEEHETGRIPITTFQKHGVWRARKILAKYGGVMIADGVGLGKTYTAGEIIRDYREQRRRVLLVCPASLRDTTWERFLNDHQILVENLSYEELANDAQLGGDKQHLKNPLDDYALVVVDEAHNYRNPDTIKRAAILRRLLAGKRRDVVFLTATPVNNSLWDLYHLLRFFMKQDAGLADRGVLSIRERFDRAMCVDPFNLSPDLLYPIIDATTVKRTRRFIKKHYASDMIRGPDGRMVPIRFPKPVASSIGYDLDAVLPGFFARLEEILMPEDGRPLLRMARYQPERYPAGGDDAGEDAALVGLLRSALLKRFESSAEAFRRTVGRMIRAHEAFLDALARGKVARKEFFRELSAAEDEGEIEDLLQASEHAEDASAYDVARLGADVRADLTLLREMAAEAAKVRPEGDPKLAVLVEELAAIAKQAADDALDDEDARRKRKALVFSHYEDTIDWIEEHLRRAIDRDPRLAAFRGRVASVSGAEARGGVAREKALHGFAPVSTGALPPDAEDRFDLLLCTDVLAEGMNLQQCRNVVNYDLPWNPMRLVQRHGRVDRIASPHRKVFLRTFFPDARLDALLDLEARVRRKLAQAAASVGVEEAPIERGATGEQSFAESREEIEKLHRADASIYEAGGTEGAAQTGEEYRQELRRALAKHGDAIRDLPWRAGSGMRKGQRAGHLFCATVAERVYLRFVPREPDGEIVGELGTCLRLLECTEETPRVLSAEMALGAYDAWATARRSIFDAWAFETDPANLQPRIRKLNRDVAAFLRANPPADIEHERLHRCLDAIESPWPRREENLLRLAWERESPTPVEKARFLVKEVEDIGAEPFRPPDALPPIEVEDIHPICWMAIDSESRDLGP
ncbi:MAG: helicase-related protein [Myxococcota bacterium]|nr:helicase-related protein [Myxococcota bacterium]